MPKRHRTTSFLQSSHTDGCDRSQTTKALTGQRTPKAKKEASRMSSHRYVWLLTVMALCVVSATGQHKAGDLKIKPYVFENGKGEKVDAELGVLLVPENRSDLQSNLIELAFVRFKSTAKNPGPPIVYLAGGPG